MASRPENQAMELGRLLTTLAGSSHLKAKLNTKDLQRLKAALILRGIR
jgi:hypothetical protein